MMTSVKEEDDFQEHHDMSQAQNPVNKAIDQQQQNQGAKTQTILEKDENTRVQLFDVYRDIQEFFSSYPDECLENEILAEYPDYKKMLTKYQTDLHEDERPLVVTGEVSSGKSTLLNYLLGFDILPVGNLATTGVICRIRSSQEKKVEIFKKGVSLCDTISIENETEKESMKKLEKVINPNMQRDTHDVEYVDIYWPIPFLWKNICVVDTPGVGESEAMNERLQKYLPQAAGLIYVIDSTRGGGLADDRVVPLIKRQVSEIAANRKQKFDPSCALFVCNKWDLIKDEDEDDDDEEEAERVLNSIKTKLESLWHNFDIGQLHCISAKKALRKRKKGLQLPDEMLRLERALVNLVENSIGTESRRSRQWLKKFLKHIEKCLNSHLNITSLTNSKKEGKLKEAEELLENLEEACKTSAKTLRTNVDDECRTISNLLYSEIKNKNVRDKIFSWKDTILPTGSNMEELKRQAYQIISNKFIDWLTKELKNVGCDQVKEKLDKLLEKEKQSMTEKVQTLENILHSKAREDKDGASDAGIVNASDSAEVSDVFSPGEKVIAVVTAPLWLPLGVVAGIVAMAGIGVLTAKRKIELLHFNSDKIKYMDEWAEELLEQYNENGIQDRLKEQFFNQFYHSVKTYFEQEVQQIIQSWKILLSNHKTETRTNKEIVERYEPMLNKCVEIQKRVQDLT